MMWLVAIVFSIFLLPVLAADIYVEDYKVHIEGVIRDGDAERVASLVSGMRIVSSFNVNTLGGNVDEALKIASLIEGTSARFVIKKGGICASSCFFMFISSQDRSAIPFYGEEGQNPSAENRAKGYYYVGIHRPYLASKDEVTAASADKQEALMQVIRDYLRKKQVPQYLVDEMMGRSSNQIYWLREKDLDLLGDYSPGLEEVLIKKCGYNKTVKYSISMTNTQLNELYDCISEVRQREYLPSQTKYIKRLATGWRPWGKR